jgi:outer membrane protein assembly factor BamB
MWYRPVAVAGLLLGLAALSSAQYAGSGAAATPLDRTVLDRLNLRAEWVQYLPIQGRLDGIAIVQTIDDQLFIQTRTGMLIAMDARTGQLQWSAALGNRGATPVYPVAANSRFVFAINVTRLYAFYRDTGVVEFNAELSFPTLNGFAGAPILGPAADETGVYIAAGAGGAGATRMVAYNLPRSVPVPTAVEQGKSEDVYKGANPVDELSKRYPPAGASRTMVDKDTFDPAIRVRPPGVHGAGTGHRSPSLAVTGTTTPPYSLDNGARTPSVTTLPTLRQPYRLRTDFQRDIQRTPSISTIPPAVAATLALTDLRPKGIEPSLRWEYGMTGRLDYPLVLTPARVWAISGGQLVMAVSKVDKKREVAADLLTRVAAQPGQAGTIGYFPLDDGNLMAVDLTGGNAIAGVNQLWRSNVGGIMNRTPLVTADAVYTAGDNSGVARVDRKSGEVIWRSDNTADLVAAVNHEFVYVRDRQGRLLVFDARRATDPTRRFAAPLTGVDAGQFTVPVMNTVTDRIYLATETGLIMCLRDASSKYARPVHMAPPLLVDLPQPKKDVKKDDMMMPDAAKMDEKKMDEKKMDEKK